ncbi:L-threonylcarbamoyladenylate synthase [Carboxydochorda subterranea]|uniref:Threonylcarbamoyl-AMP synthase n=1 Tax=Carboxydichorda subterranea TaxID=3109565 RepID=A0ABZ1BW87_9FIRM|nr:L-threonylcarbamoyladenylate synthase [Limnochorda sp. L945t]WRP16941.1 L-threonylcarbamoyladenylate synthase [Limnochorda sp. L945t]
MRVATRLVRVDPEHPDPAVLREAGETIRRGGLVAFPTETVYGLGADALSDRAVRRIFEAKGRPSDNPLIVHVASVEGAMSVAHPDPRGRWHALASRFWPGPLTLVLPRRDNVSKLVTAGLDTVAVRMPRHPVALGLIKAAGVPIAAPSANRSGRPSPVEASHVMDDLDGRVEWVLDGGPTGVGVESTVLDLSGDPPVVLRPGGIGVEALREALTRVDVLSLEAPPPGPVRSPGLKYRHYAPRAPVVVMEGPSEWVARRVQERIEQMQAGGRPVRLGLFFTDETLELLRSLRVLPRPGVWVVSAGPRDDLAEVARRLFGALRELDCQRPALILAEAVANRGVGLAINNRLRRAAAGRVDRPFAQP